MRNTRDGLRLVAVTARGAADGAAEREAASLPMNRNVVYLRAMIGEGAAVQFSYSFDNRTFARIGETFIAKPGRWVGAKLGLFAAATPPGASAGHALFDWFRIAKSE